MFCHKCGSQSLDGAAFCQKCGTKLMADRVTPQTSEPSVSTVSEPTPTKVSAIPVVAVVPKSIESDRQDIPSVPTPMAMQHVDSSAETVLFTRSGGQIVGALGTSGGHIKLTNQRLVHESLGKKVKFEIDVNDIVGYQRGYTVSLLTGLVFPFATNNAFIIHTKQGVAYKFSVQKRDELLPLFKQLIPSAERLPDETKKEAKKRAWSGLNPNDKQARGQRRIIVSMCATLLLLVIVVSVFDAVNFGGFGSNKASEAEVLGDNSPRPSTAVNEDSSTNTKNETESVAADLNQVEVLYEGIPLSQFFEMSVDEVIAALGTDAYHDEYKIYGDIDFHLSNGELTSGESMIPEKFTIGGTSLDKNRAELIALLGNPSSESDGGNGYEMTFEQAGYKLTIATGDKYSTAWRIYIIPSSPENMTDSNMANSNMGEVLYKGTPVSQYFYCTEYELKDTLGEPEYEGYAYAGYCYEYDGTEFIFDETGVTLIWASNPNLLTVEGITLDKNQAELIATLGEPDTQGWVQDEGIDIFEIGYSSPEAPFPVSLTFRLSNPDQKASSIIIRPYSENYDEGYSDSGFRRLDYYTGISQTDLLRYPDNHLYNKVYFSGYTVNNVMEPRVYLVRDGNNYLIIDDRNGSGANTVDNDKVSVYGTFYGNQPISFTDGRNQQVPHIIADKLVINTILPQDPNDFAQAYVEAVNRYSKAWSDENEYLSGTKVRLILNSSSVAGVSDYFMPVEAEVLTSFYVDGYSIPFFNVVIDGEPIGGGWSGSYGKMDKLPITVEKGKLYIVVGNLELLFGMDGNSHARLHFESIEPYE